MPVLAKGNAVQISKIDKCTDIALTFEYVVSLRNQGLSPKSTYIMVKNRPNTKGFGNLFASKKDENNWLKHVVNESYFNQELQRTTSRQVGYAVRDQCMGWGSAEWHRLKTQ